MNRFNSQQELVVMNLRYAVYVVNKYFQVLPFQAIGEVRVIFDAAVFQAGLHTDRERPFWRNPNFFSEDGMFPGTLLERILNLLKFIAKSIPEKDRIIDVDPVIMEFEILVAAEKLLS